MSKQAYSVTYLYST